MNLKQVPIKDLKHYAKNRNQHTPEQIERLAKLITHYGFRDPLIVDESTMEVICGNGTLMALKLLGNWTTVPCVLQQFKDEDERYAFSIAHNSIAAWSDLDMVRINEELPELGPDFDIDLLGFPNFFLEPAEKGVPEEKEADLKKCPNCGVLIDG